VVVAMRDEHQVAAIDGLEVLGRHGVVHDPWVDEHFLAFGAADLPRPMTDPREADLSVERHAHSPLYSARKSRFSHTASAKIPIAATVQRIGKKRSQGWR